MVPSSPNPYASLKSPFTACELCLMRREQAQHQADAGVSTSSTKVGYPDHAQMSYTPSLSRALSSASSSSSSSSQGSWSPSVDGPSCKCMEKHPAETDRLVWPGFGLA